MRNLRNIDAILAATRDDLRRAQRLKLRADDAKYKQLDILSLILMYHNDVWMHLNQHSFHLKCVCTFHLLTWHNMHKYK